MPHKPADVSVQNGDNSFQMVVVQGTEEECSSNVTFVGNVTVLTRYIGTNCPQCNKIRCDNCNVTVESNYHVSYGDYESCDSCGKNYCNNCKSELEYEDDSYHSHCSKCVGQVTVASFHLVDPS
jgi:hypothetical protein